MHCPLALTAMQRKAALEEWAAEARRHAGQPRLKAKL